MHWTANVAPVTFSFCHFFLFRRARSLHDVLVFKPFSPSFDVLLSVGNMVLMHTLTNTRVIRVMGIQGMGEMMGLVFFFAAISTMYYIYRVYHYIPSIFFTLVILPSSLVLFLLSEIIFRMCACVHACMHQSRKDMK